MSKSGSLYMEIIHLLKILYLQDSFFYYFHYVGIYLFDRYYHIFFNMGNLSFRNTPLVVIHTFLLYSLVISSILSKLW